MKFSVSTTIWILLFIPAFTQEMSNIEVRPIEYVWERQSDNRVVFGKDSLYQDVLRKSFLRAFEEKKYSISPLVDVTVSKLPPLRSQPKFNTSVPNSDSGKSYVFIQLFDRSIPPNPNNPYLAARFDVRYRLLKKGVAFEDRLMSFTILRRDPPLGMITIKRYPIHPSQFELLCDTIAFTILNDEAINERDVWLNPACAYSEEAVEKNFHSNNLRLADNRTSVTVDGENGFSILLDSVRDMQIGKNKHRAANTAGSLLTFFSNIDTQKKRSTLFVTDHTFKDDSATYHAYVSYVDTRLAERRRIKDEEGFKSNEVGEYRPAWKAINRDTKHVVTINGDTVSSFNIEFRLKEDHFDRMWNGHDLSTVDSIPASFNNLLTHEMEMKGKIDNNFFVLTTSGGGHIKKVELNDEHVFTFYSNTAPDGLVMYGSINKRQLKILTLISLLSDKYFNYN